MLIGVTPASGGHARPSDSEYKGVHILLPQPLIILPDYCSQKRRKGAWLHVLSNSTVIKWMPYCS